LSEPFRTLRTLRVRGATGRVPNPPNPLGLGFGGEGSEPSEPSGFGVPRGGFGTLRTLWVWGLAVRVPNPPNPLGLGFRGEGSEPSEPSGCHGEGSEPSEPSGFGVPRGGFRTLRTLCVRGATGRVPNPPNPLGSGCHGDLRLGCHGEGSEPSEPSGFGVPRGGFRTLRTLWVRGALWCRASLGST
jgi:hypothetical protein